MRKLVYILVPFIIACSGAEDEGNNVNYEDFAGETGIETDSFLLNIDTVLDLSTFEGKLIGALSSDYDTTVNTEFNPLDRFSFSESKKIGFKAKYEVPYGKTTMVYPQANFFYYSFNDTTTTKNAFYNYLDGLSASGEVGAVKINQDLNSIKSPPVFLLVYDTMIVTTEYFCEHAKNDWQPLQDSIEAIYGDNYRYKINLSCGGPLKWGR